MCLNCAKTVPKLSENCATTIPRMCLNCASRFAYAPKSCIHQRTNFLRMLMLRSCTPVACARPLVVRTGKFGPLREPIRLLLFSTDQISYKINCVLTFHQLVENVVLLLEVLNVWDEDEDNVEWEGMAQVGVRILLAFISQPETEYCATASYKLSKLLKARKVTSQGELCYILGRLHQAFVASRKKGISLRALPWRRRK